METFESDLVVRLWSVHPRQLDRIGLIACWRESLLAQAVLSGTTKGYQHHPQLHRFRADPDPVGAIGAYLVGLAAEATRRGYKFDTSRIIDPCVTDERICVTQGQLLFEWQHLGSKLFARSPADAQRWLADNAEPHPVFIVVDGERELWEKA